MNKDMICIVCPVGCHLTVNTDNLNVTGNACKRGVVYAENELTDPKRVVTSTVKIKGGNSRRCPVKTDDAIGKEMNFECMETLKEIELISPVKRGDIIMKNFLGTDANLVVTKDM